MNPLGLGCLASVIFLWVFSGFLVNKIGMTYDRPFFLTYLNTSFMALYLPFVRSWSNLRLVARAAAEFAFLWFLSNLFNNASYFYTSVPSATIIACTSSFWTLLAGHLIGIDKFTIRKFGLLLISMCGVGLISYQDGARSAEKPLFGNILALLGALTYGLYTCLLKIRVEDQTKVDTKLFMGLVGLFSLVGLWPVILVLHFTGIETLEMPPRNIWGLVVINGLAGMFSDLLWVLATLMTSPLVVAVGLSGTIPLSVIWQWALGGNIGGILYFSGAVLVFCSFVGVVRADSSPRL